VKEIFLPIDRSTGQPRGFAFIEFSDSGSIAEAISKFDGAELKGRSLKVNEARARPPRSEGGSNFVPDMPPQGRPAKPKGSRRGIRGKKRGF
jgi:RNA recognition motif-containing protein